MTPGTKKYLIGGFFLSLAVAAVVVSCSPIGRSAGSGKVPPPIFDRTGTVPAQLPGEDTVLSSRLTDSLSGTARPEIDPTADSIPAAGVRDTLPAADTTLTDTTTLVPPVPAGPRRRDKPFLEAPVVAKAQDSVVYDRRRNLIFHYNKGDLTYEDNNLVADYIVVNATTKEILGTGMVDTAGVTTRPEFLQAGTSYTMDTVIYNLDSRKAIVQGVATKDGEGYMLGSRMKRMPDGTMNGAHLKYTTCDRIDHPHFYIAMTKARVIPGKKIITGPAYFVMEDVPIYFLGIPGGFFPMSVGPTAGIVMPTWGEEANRGFYLRGGGYYFTFGDHIDLRLTADIYTLGSWGLNAASNYVKRYKFRGGLNASYNRFVMGEKNSTDYQKSSTISVRWNHSQDPKANPRQTFSASVDFQTAGQRQLATTSLQDHLNTSTTSSIQYGRNWDVGATNINLTASFNMTTNSSDSTISMTLPNMSLSVGSFAPFKRRAAIGKPRWYEKVTLDYAMQAQNQTVGRDGKAGVRESDFFSRQTLKDLSNGISHRIGLKTSLNLLNYINFSPSFNYQESWNFKRQMQAWDPDGGSNGQGAMVDKGDIPPEFGFYRTYSWALNGSFSTKLYGVFEVKRKPGKTGWLQAIRHMVTPSLGFSYAPDFKDPRYGFYQYVQNSESGSVLEYMPVMGSPRITPSGPQASITASISNQVEIKVRSSRDSTGVKKITLIEQLAFNGISWNFLRDSMQLSNVGISLRTGEIFKGFALQLSGNWTPYKYVQVGNTMKQIGKFNIGGGKFGRITNTSWSFGKTFNSPQGASPGAGSINGAFVNPYDPYNFTNGLDPATRRQYMVQGYYDFDVPWSFTFNYNVNYQYSNTVRPVITQNLGFNGNVTLTEKWGFNFNSGYDFSRRKISHMQLNLMRDLHCWDMTFSWVPMGMTKMYSFHIGIKSGMLRDIKYDKSSNLYDNLVR